MIQFSGFKIIRLMQFLFIICYQFETNYAPMSKKTPLSRPSTRKRHAPVVDRADQLSSTCSSMGQVR